MKEKYEYFTLWAADRAARGAPKGASILMTWRRWGLKDNPYTLNDINETTLDLFVGRSNEIKCLQNALTGNKRIIFLEGDQGTGKTTVGNFWRYSSMQKRLCFTPYIEICVGSPANFYSFTMNVIEALNWSLPQNHPFILRDAEFKAHENKSKEFFDALIVRKSSDQPLTDVEDRYLYSEAKGLFESVSHIVSKLSYEYGAIIQISFTELNQNSAGEDFFDFKKKLCELLAIEGFRWLLIGKPLLEELLYHSESRILPNDFYKILIGPLDLSQVHELLLRRKDYLGLNQNAKLPLAPEVVEYLYLLGDGNLTKIFPICEKITELPSGYQAMPELDLKLTKPLIAKYFQDEIRQRWKLSPASADILSFLVREEGVSPCVIADRMRKLRPNVSKILMNLKQINLVRAEVKGRNRVYYPSMAAKIAFA